MLYRSEKSLVYESEICECLPYLKYTRIECKIIGNDIWFFISLKYNLFP